MPKIKMLINLNIIPLKTSKKQQILKEMSPKCTEYLCFYNKKIILSFGFLKLKIPKLWSKTSETDIDNSKKGPKQILQTISYLDFSSLWIATPNTYTMTGSTINGMWSWDKPWGKWWCDYLFMHSDDVPSSCGGKWHEIDRINLFMISKIIQVVQLGVNYNHKSVCKPMLGITHTEPKAGICSLSNVILAITSYNVCLVQ